MTRKDLTGRKGGIRSTQVAMKMERCLLASSHVALVSEESRDQGAQVGSIETEIEWGREREEWRDGYYERYKKRNYKFIHTFILEEPDFFLRPKSYLNKIRCSLGIKMLAVFKSVTFYF